MARSLFRTTATPTSMPRAMAIAFFAVCSAPLFAADADSTRFLGSDGRSTADVSFPDTWTDRDYAWNIALEGKGHSSPVIWGDTLFVTSGLDDGTRMVHAIDVASGSHRWKRTIPLDVSHLHTKNSLTSGSPAVGAERVYVPVSNDRQFLVIAFTHDGDEVWRRDLGAFESQHGPGSSPVVIDDMVVIACDQIGPSFIVAMDAASGQTRWKSERASRRAAYSTPLPVPGHEDILICSSGAEGITGLRKSDGSRVFATGEMPMRVVSSPTYIAPPVFDDGAVLITCGSGGSGKLMQAWELRPLSSGDWKATLAWSRKSTIPYVPTPIYHDGLLYLWNDNGVVCCVDPATGEDIWKKRVGGKFTGSPLLAGDRLYSISESGEVAVVGTGRQFTQYEGGSIGDGSHATPVVAGGTMFLRSFDRLAALKAK